MKECQAMIAFSLALLWPEVDGWPAILILSFGRIQMLIFQVWLKVISSNLLCGLYISPLAPCKISWPHKVSFPHKLIFSLGSIYGPLGINNLTLFCFLFPKDVSKLQFWYFSQLLLPFWKCLRIRKSPWQHYLIFFSYFVRHFIQLSEYI